MSFDIKFTRQEEHSAILSTFIKLPLVIKSFVLSSFEWLFYTSFTVLILCYEGDELVAVNMRVTI